MTRSCSALGCTTRDSGLSREGGISFHQFPLDTLQRTRWIHAVNRVDPKSKKVWIPGPGAILCSKHFVETDFESYGMRRKLKKGAVPSVFQHKNSRSECQRLRTVQKAVKQPLSNHAYAEEVITEDHNYSLRNPELLSEQQRKMKGRLHLPENTAAAHRSLLHCQRKASDVIRELVEKQLLSEDTADLLQALFSDLPWEFDCTRPNSGYTREMKQFASTLHLYSNKAYEYVRKRFPLPHPSSLMNWLTKDVTHPGFSESIFQSLQQRVESHAEAYQYCALMMDGVPLRSQLEWDLATQQLAGFVDLGAGALDADEAPLASESVVLMAVGIFGCWRVPLGYFFVSGVTGHLLAQLLRQAVNKLSNIGITVLSVTSTAHDVATAKALGMQIKPGNIKCTFQHPPGSSRQIVYFFDACHALKLIRNTFQFCRRIEFAGHTAEWHHIVELAALQEKKVVLHGSCVSSKLGRSRGCCVSRATQVFSASVADMLGSLQLSGLPAFQDCEGTVKFVRLVSSLFEVFSGRNHHGKGLKGPVSAGTYGKVARLLNEAQSVFATLRDISGRRVLEGRRKLGFLGFLLNAESLKWLYTNYVQAEKGPPRSLLTYAFSLDHLELFFRALGQAHATSGNPAGTAFQDAYCKLVTSYSFVPGAQEDSLFGDISTLDASLLRRTDSTLHAIHALCCPSVQEAGSLDKMFCLELIPLPSTLSDALTELPMAGAGPSAAGLVTKKLAASLGCEVCIAALWASKGRVLSHDSHCRRKKVDSLGEPSECVQKIVNTAACILRTHIKAKACQTDVKQHLPSIEQKIFYRLSGHSPFFPELNDHLFDGELCISNHYTKLLRKVVQGYLSLRAEQEQKWRLSGILLGNKRDLS
ncbi:DNA transposase THAP9 [Hemicordylus capensis]|uniref:DNA transposase THAP9 n=1 Tax=Hemicordylus capensis TaxID=884348 RepID=UPI00230381DF|nr:DNA transposase THAP9 [Hemicordylus capensis]